MTNRVHFHERLIFSLGTQVVTLRSVMVADGSRVLHPKGAVGCVIRSPKDSDGSYRVRFLDGVEATLARNEVVSLAKYKEGEIGDTEAVMKGGLFDRVIYRCVIGSRAYGFDHDESDTDRRGIYVPPADLHWSLYGVPEQLECDQTQEVYWEIQKFLVLALKANPNVLECLFTPLVEFATPLAEELLAMRSIFLSRMVCQTYNGYVMSQFKRMKAHERNHSEIQWKPVMHLIRLLISGTTVLREGIVPVRIDEDRERLLAIKRGEMPWSEIDQWRRGLHEEFDRAFQKTTLPERPDYEKANQFLVKVRRWAVEESQ